MTLDRLLEDFYKKNQIPEDGGIYQDTFNIKIVGLNLKLPNPRFRKEVIHIHDIQHILNQCDTSWKGEGHIAGWEISTGLWKYFPISLFSLWATGHSFRLYPKAVFQGFKKGLNDIGIIDLKITKSEFMKMEFDQLVELARKEKRKEMGVFQWIKFIFWILLSQIIFLLPFLSPIILILLIFI